MASILPLILAMAAADTAGQAHAGLTPFGRWQTPDRGGIVELYACGAALCGKIVGGANPVERDTKNKNPDLRNRLLMGLVFMTGFRGGPRAWSGGKIYRPADGGTYSGTIRLVGENRLTLTGCIVWPLCRTQNWQRIIPPRQ
ncbi:MAG: DUF2147 domain-containing protein [Sphingomonadales bacterium]|jgi:uncharacterized protein (DUF2147 family)|nr:DUF2147 domain-containing protein [Sphingomonadales bacterium]